MEEWLSKPYQIRLASTYLVPEMAASNLRSDRPRLAEAKMATKGKAKKQASNLI